MVGSCEAWHCRVTLSPWLMSALEGARVILVASGEWVRKRELIERIREKQRIGNRDTVGQLQEERESERRRGEDGLG